MLGAMGSGLTPPNHGLRSLWISVTWILPPASSRGIQPAPEPHIGSTRTRMSAAQRVEVERPLDVDLVPVEGVERLDHAGGLAVGEGTRGRCLAGVLADGPLERGQDLRAGRGAGLGDLTLKPLSVHGLCEAVIITPQAALRSTTSYEVIWVGIGLAGERHRDVVGEQDLGGGLGEVLAGEAAVVADHDALGRGALVADVLGDALGAAADVLVRVVVGDARAPAVGAEDDRRQGRSRRGVGS